MLLGPTDRQWRLRRDAEQRMAADNMRVLPVQIPRAVRVAEAPRYQAPTAVLEPDSRVSWVYRKVADLILEEAA